MPMPDQRAKEIIDWVVQREGKYVNVKMRQTKAVDAAPGEATSGYFIVDYAGDILSPAVRPHPEHNPEGPLCLYIQTRDQLRKVYALDLNDIEEVDDEVVAPAPVQVNMSGLTNPNS